MMQSKQFSNPFPGLRPFKTEEYRVFFGREGQADQLLNRLQRSRLLAVVGTSGSGKSSLIRAGLLPALQGGMMAGAGSGWRIAVMRPGGDPIGNLARELAQKEVLPEAGGGLSKEETVAVIDATLRRGSLGIVDVIRQGHLGANEKLLIVVDQFEELFRFRAAREKTSTADEAAAFVKLLLEASQQRAFSVYVVLTMRSDFLGDCAQFQGLPEAINDGQYLIPRMTRDERRVAVTGPIGVTRSKITEPLVNRLLNDVGDNPDQLPILQHALMRTWNHWHSHRQNGEPIGIEHYEAVGTMSEALSQHADEAFNELPDDRSRQIAEKLFKALTERGPDNREIRHPMRLSSICEIADASLQEVIAVIDVFRGGGRSFLMPPSDVPLQLETVIDISHESLIRNWQRLKTWVNEEAQSARIYRRLAEAAVLHFEKMEGLLQDPGLQIALDWYEESKPNAFWAERYHPAFALAIGYLQASRAEREAKVAAAELQREQEIARERRELEMAQRYAEVQRRAAQRLKRLSFALVILSVLALGAAGGAVYAYTLAKQNAEGLRREKVLAVNATDRAQLAQMEAERQRKLAEDQKKTAVEQRKLAEDQKKLADLRALQASAAEKTALAEKARADQQARIAAKHAEDERIAKENAKELQKKAEAARIDAEEQRKIAYEKLKEAEEAREAVITEQKKTAEVQQANRWFREASADSKRGSKGRDDAVRKYTDAAAAFEKMKDSLAVAATYVEIGEILMASDELGDLQRALERFESAAELYEKAKEYNSAAFIAVRYAEFIANPSNAAKIRDVSDNSDDPRQVALEVFDAAKDFYKSGQNNEGIIDVLTRMGELSESSTVPGKRDVDFYEQTLPFFDKSKDRDKLSEMLLRIGRAYKKKGAQEANRASEYFERAITIHQQAGDLAGVTDTLLSLAFDTGDWRSDPAETSTVADNYATRAEALWTNDRNGRADTLRKIGRRYLSVCERALLTRRVTGSPVCGMVIPKALDYSERARALYKETNNPLGQALSMETIGDIQAAGLPPLQKSAWNQSFSRNTARAMYVDALAFFRQANTKSKDMAETLENIADLTDDPNSFKEAQNYYEEAGGIYAELKDRRSAKRIDLALKRLQERIERARAQPKPASAPAAKPSSP